MDNPELVDLFESDLSIIIQKAHKSGLTFWKIFKVLFDKCLTVMMQSESEYYLKGGR